MRLPRAWCAWCLVSLAYPAGAADGAARQMAPSLPDILIEQARSEHADGIQLLYELEQWLVPPAPPAPAPFAALGVLQGEIFNGGFDQYFFNGCGSDWKLALAGLDALGDAEGRACLLAAVAVFPQQAPADDSAARHQQMQDLGRSAEEAWGRLDSRWYRNRSALQALILTWVRDHAREQRFLKRPQHPRTFDFEYLNSDGLPEEWGKSLGELVDKHPLMRSNGNCQSDMAVEFLPFDILASPPDEMHIIAIHARDPHLLEIAKLCARLGALVHVRCLVVGALPAGSALPQDAVLIPLAGTGAAEIQRLAASLKEWLPPAP